jgi:hypothetical protein
MPPPTEHPRLEPLRVLGLARLTGTRRPREVTGAHGSGVRAHLHGDVGCSRRPHGSAYPGRGSGTPISVFFLLAAFVTFAADEVGAPPGDEPSAKTTEVGEVFR